MDVQIDASGIRTPIERMNKKKTYLNQQAFDKGSRSL